MIRTEMNPTIIVNVILPPAPDKCQICGEKHFPDMPHNPGSLFYKMTFRQERGYWPDWSDACAHCPDDIFEICRAYLAYFKIDVPARSDP